MSQKFHSFNLANGAYAGNFHVERLAATPAPLTFGRFWYNTVEKTFNYSDLDTGGAVVVKTFSDAASFASAVTNLTNLINAEAARATAAEQAESTRAQGVEADLQAQITAEVAARAQAVADEATARIAGDASEAAARTAAIAVAAQNAADALAAETSSRVTDDAALNTRVDGVVAELNKVETSAGLNADGTFTAPENTTYLGEATTLKDGLVKLDKAISDDVAALQATDATMNAALAAETQRATAAEQNLQTQLTEWVNTQLAGNEATDAAEQAARIAGDAALQAELNAAEAGAGLAIDGTYVVPTDTSYLDASVSIANATVLLDGAVKVVSDAVAAESTARATADATFQTQLTNEINARTSAVSALQNELNATQAGSGLETDGTYVVSTGANYISAATTLADADNKLDSALKAVSDRTGVIESTTIPALQSALADEVAARTAADTNEKNRAQAVEADLQSQINTEVTARQADTAAATAALTAETTRATGVESSLQSQINGLTAAAGDGAAALKSALNASRYSYKSSGPALQHVVKHNLNTEFYSANLMIKGTDDVWRNDVAPIEDDNLNQFTVYLTEAADIKISGQSNAALA